MMLSPHVVEKGSHRFEQGFPSFNLEQRHSKRGAGTESPGVQSQMFLHLFHRLRIPVIVLNQREMILDDPLPLIHGGKKGLFSV